MSNCIRCGRQYNEPADEQGDHDCPSCGLSPEEREVYGKEVSDADRTTGMDTPDF